MFRCVYGWRRKLGVQLLPDQFHAGRLVIARAAPRRTSFAAKASCRGPARIEHAGHQPSGFDGHRETQPGAARVLARARVTATRLVLTWNIFNAH